MVVLWLMSCDVVVIDFKGRLTRILEEEVCGHRRLRGVAKTHFLEPSQTLEWEKMNSMCRQVGWFENWLTRSYRIHSNHHRSKHNQIILDSSAPLFLPSDSGPSLQSMLFDHSSLQIISQGRTIQMQARHPQTLPVLPSRRPDIVAAFLQKTSGIACLYNTEM